MVEDIRTVIEGTDLSEQVTPQMLEPARAALEQFIVSWRLKQEETLLNLLRQTGHFTEPVTREHLLRATAVFKCTRCITSFHSSMVGYPRILNHACNMQPLAPYESHWHLYTTPTGTTKRGKDKGKGKRKELKPISSEVAPGSLLKHAHGIHFRGIDLSGIVFHEVGYQHTVQLLSALDLSLETTAEDLRANGPAVFCRCNCYSAILPKPAQLRWPQLVSPLSLRLQSVSRSLSFLACSNSGSSWQSLFRMLSANRRRRDQGKCHTDHERYSKPSDWESTYPFLRGVREGLR
mgnify:CR=1 FL=1